MAGGKPRIRPDINVALQWRHNEGDGVTYHQRLDC